MSLLFRGFKARIYEEGYCCVYGYLKLCKARGETSSGMGKNIEVSPDTIRHHARKLAKGKYLCGEREDCLRSVIEELESEKEKAP